MNYDEARKYLAEVSAKGNLLGLESIKTLLEELGNPQDSLKFVHIAGTNGKGSVMSYLSSILQEAGYSVGRYISPALFSYEERIQINGKLIPKEEVARLTTRIAAARGRIRERGEAQTTIFEVETAMSFLYFQKQNCDLVLLETGMGGSEDATNAVTTTLLEIISSISMDHMEFLGNTLEKIAWNKAGIIKQKTLVVSDIQDQRVYKVLVNACREKGAVLHMLEEKHLWNVRYGLKEQRFSYRGMEELEISLAGTCQIHNAALAVDAAMALKSMGYKIAEEHVRSGLRNTVWEGRFQILREAPTVIMDGAHNPNAAEVLMDAVDQYFPKNKIYYIFGVFSDKEYDKIIRITAGRAEKIFTVQTKDHPRALPAEELADEVSKVNPNVIPAGTVTNAMTLALEEAEQKDVILVFGSLSFLYEAKEYFEHQQGI